MSDLPKPQSFCMEVERGVATIILDRPERLNALTFAVYRELAETFERLHDVPSVRAIVLTGRGRAFCSGGDVEDIIAELFDRDSEQLLAFTRMTGRLIQAIREVPVPVIGAISGVAVGAGAVMAAACDLRIAAKDARFGFIFPRVGLSGADMGASYLLPRIVGLGNASQLLYFGDIIDVDTAASMGFVNAVVETGEEALREAQSWALRLAKGPRFAHSVTKTMLEQEDTMRLAEAIEAEAKAQAVCMEHPDFRTAHDAYNAKEKPLYQGAEVCLDPIDSEA